MGAIHMYVGAAVIALNAGTGVWGGIAWLRREPSVAFWYLLRTAQAAVVLQAGVGLALIGLGSRPGEELHLVYGLAPLVVTLVTEALRATAVSREAGAVGDFEDLPHAEQVALARRVVVHEMAIMTVGALVIVGLALRAYFVAT